MSDDSLALVAERFGWPIICIICLERDIVDFPQLLSNKFRFIFHEVYQN